MFLDFQGTSHHLFLKTLGTSPLFFGHESSIINPQFFFILTKEFREAYSNNLLITLSVLSVH